MHYSLWPGMRPGGTVKTFVEETGRITRSGSPWPGGTKKTAQGSHRQWRAGHC